MGYFYDSQNKLLYTHQVPVPSFAETVQNIKRNPGAIYAAMGMKTSEQVELFIANARAKGSILKDLGSGLVSVRTAIGQVSAINARQKDTSEELASVDIFNTEMGVLMGSTLYDMQENIVSQTFYKYKLNDDNVLVPEAIHSESWEEDPVTGEKAKVENDTYFENISATVNPN
jgi:hypothetical protein